MFVSREINQLSPVSIGSEVDCFATVLVEVVVLAVVVFASPTRLHGREWEAIAGACHCHYGIPSYPGGERPAFLSKFLEALCPLLWVTGGWVEVLLLWVTGGVGGSPFVVGDRGGGRQLPLAVVSVSMSLAE